MGGGTVVVVGSANADHVLRTTRLPGPGETVAATSLEWHAGGKGANQAAAAALAGAPTRFIGCVGTDEHGDRLVEALRERGVHCLVRVVDGPSGQAFVTVDDGGENMIVVVEGANGALDVADVAGLGLNERDVAVGVLEVAADVVLAFFLAAGEATRVLNPTPPERCTQDLLDAADVVVLNEHEQAVLQVPDDKAVVTLGADGARFRGRLIPGEVVQGVVDTTGAGDCFVGTLCARLASGDSLEVAVGAAHRAAAGSVTRPGAMESYR